jgi:hypothetical protein
MSNTICQQTISTGLASLAPRLGSGVRLSNLQSVIRKGLARLKGFEPLTHSLEGCCSIHLSYRRIQLRIADFGLKRRSERIPNPQLNWSGREDLNLRLSAPKADALPGCATPRIMPQLHTPDA